MRYFGIDIGSDEHVVAAVDSDSAVAAKPFKINESADGYARLLAVLGAAPVALVAFEATGHYWRNLFAALTARGYAVALLNPLQTHHFAKEELSRTKTDAIDALGIARFAAQKHPVVTRLAEGATDELRELVRHRDRLVADFGDRVRQLHRLVDLGFPEFTRHVKGLDSMLASALLAEYPNAQAFAGAAPRRVAKLVYDGVHKVGNELAQALIASAKVSVGAHHGPAYRIQVRHTCQDLDTLRRRIKELDGDISTLLDDHEVGSLLTTIDGIGPTTAARVIAELGDINRFANAAALAAYVGVVPGLKQSGKRQSPRAGLSPIGHARLRTALWMPLLTAVRRNAWLKAFYDRLVGRGKPPKVALIAAMRKLLAAIYAVARDRKPFVPRPVTVP